MQVQRGVSEGSGGAGKLEDGSHGVFGVTRMILQGSSGPRAGSGPAPGVWTEAGRGFGSAVRSPAAAPVGPGCAAAGAGPGPC